MIFEMLSENRIFPNRGYSLLGEQLIEMRNFENQLVG